MLIDILLAYKCRSTYNLSSTFSPRRRPQMRVSRVQAQKNHERIIDVASQLFRERGFDGIGLNDVMEAAGLTRGGFYGHFPSKEELAVEACGRALKTTLE